MTASGDIASEMRSIGAVIGHARDVLNAGEMVDVAPLEGRVAKLCERLAELPGGEGAALRPGLLALIDEFSQLAGLIDSRLEGLRDDLKQTSGRTQALSAYGQAARPDKPKR